MKALEFLQKRQESTEEKLAVQQKVIGELAAQLAGLQRHLDIAEPEPQPLNVLKEDSLKERGSDTKCSSAEKSPRDVDAVKSPRELEENRGTAVNKRTHRSSVSVVGKRRCLTTTGQEIETYEFRQSFWDASLLLYIGDLATGDKIILTFGLIINFSLQLCLIATVYFDMLQTDYNESTAGEMLEWRVKTGQADSEFNNVFGKALAQRLCSRQLWSFEQQEYDLMYDYLYKPVPGFFLSILALLVWVLTCMAEYRDVMEQVLAILQLPAAERGEPTTDETQQGIEVIGIRPRDRVLAMLTLCIPRLIVLGGLLMVGCPFLVNTISLTEIVLNAVALSVVLDINKCLEHVLLSHRLKAAVDLMLPIPCGSKPRVGYGGLTMKDGVRWGICIFVIMLSIFYWLIPFNKNVEATAAALCGGRQDFTYSGGNLQDTTIALKSTGEFAPTCSGLIQQNYLQTHYPGWNVTTTANLSSVKSPEALNLNIMSSVLRYAFQGCEAGMLRAPSETGDGACAAVPENLRKILNDLSGVVSGSNTEPPECPRLNASQGWDSCSLELPPVCKWSWLTNICEEKVPTPGLHHQRACKGTNLKEECDEWASFGMAHPTKNCEAWKVCDTSLEPCFSVMGSLEIHLNDKDAFADIPKVQAEANIKQAISTILELPDSSVVGLDLRLDYRQKETAAVSIKGLPLRTTMQKWRAAPAAFTPLMNTLLNASLASLPSQPPPSNSGYYSYSSQPSQPAQPTQTSRALTGDIVNRTAWRNDVRFLSATTLERLVETARLSCYVSSTYFDCSKCPIQTDDCYRDFGTDANA